MNNPAISVILPAYNAEKYISKAIRSVLEQDFTDFELLIIDDGSSDDTGNIIKQFNDPRIVYHSNQPNKGLVFSLNKGIELSRGIYIARMDADDICLPDRFSKQKEFLDNHHDSAIIACTIQFINEKEENLGTWGLDQQTISPVRIRSTMPWENCIAHPSVMGRNEVFKKYKYAFNQENIEDYDLWLRILSDRCKIEKLKEVYLLYRVHGKSITQTANHLVLPAKRVFKCKKRYLANKLKNRRINSFDVIVFFSMIKDFFVYFWKKNKDKSLYF